MIYFFIVFITIDKINMDKNQIIYLTHGIKNSPESDSILKSILTTRMLKKSAGLNKKQSDLSVVYTRLHWSLSDIYSFYKELNEYYKYILVFDLFNILINEPNLAVKIVTYNEEIPNPQTLNLEYAYSILVKMKNLPFLGIDTDFDFNKKGYLIEIIAIQRANELIDKNNPIFSIIKVPITVINSKLMDEEILKSKKEKISSYYYEEIYALLSDIEKNYYSNICDYINEEYDSEEAVKLIIQKLEDLLSYIPELDEYHISKIAEFIKEFVNKIIPKTVQKYETNPQQYCLRKLDTKILKKKKFIIKYISQKLMDLFNNYYFIDNKIGIKCSYCKLPAISICGKCKKTFYCGKKCQLISWYNNHSFECNK
jgi:hypothetical protein